MIGTFIIVLQKFMQYSHKSEVICYALVTCKMMSILLRDFSSRESLLNNNLSIFFLKAS